MPIPTPFHERTAALCTSMFWKEWAGYHAVRSFDTCHEREYFAFRHAAGLIDVTPLFKYEVHGPDAGAFLSFVMVKNIAKLKPGRVTYLCWCDDDGKVVDDGTVTRLDEDYYRVTAAEPCFSWLQRHARFFDVTIHDSSLELGSLALQGPRARDVLRQVSDADVDGLKFFAATKANLDGSEVVITRTGYTGDLGYEIWVPRQRALAVWDALIDGGKAHRLEPAGLDALDVTRVEAGFLMNGVDYFSAHHVLIESRKSTPYELGLGWTVNLKRKPFVGQDALRREKQEGSKWAFVGLEYDWDEYEALLAEFGLPPQVPSGASRDPVPIYDLRGKQVGQATSRAWSPILKKYLALASVEAAHGAVGTRLRIEATAEYQRRKVTATVVETPFFNPHESVLSVSTDRPTPGSNGKPSSSSYDAIVIGGGHNGLTSAAYLAKAGRKVLVLERRHVLGGAAVSEELYPGFTFSVCSYVVSLFRPHIIRELELPRHGLEIIPLDCSFTPQLDGRSLARWGDPERTRREIAEFSPRDAEIYPEFGLAMTKLSLFAKHIIDHPAPDPTSLNPKELLQLSRLGKAFQEFDSDLRYLNLKLLTMSASDFLDQWFESDVLKAPMSVSGIIGTFLGVRSPGTAYVLLHHYMGEIDGAARAWGFAKGGTGAISLAIARAAEGFGAEIRTESSVRNLLMNGDRAEGVVLENGDEIKAKVVLSSLDPHRTFFNVVGEDKLDADFLQQLKRYKMRGSSGKVNLALDRFPDFACRPGDGPHVQGDIAIAPGVDYLERAYDQAKYGEFSERPYINVVFPSTVDPSVAPPGKHVMSCFVQYAPYNIKEGAENWPDKREAFGDAVVDTLAEYCPTLKDSILYRQVLTPWDLEQEYGLTEGNIFHGELSLEQLLFLRPAAGWSRYRTPIPRLWLCGSGAHPGGGVMGAPGELAAKMLLATREV